MPSQGVHQSETEPTGGVETAGIKGTTATAAHRGDNDMPLASDNIKTPQAHAIYFSKVKQYIEKSIVSNETQHFMKDTNTHHGLGSRGQDRPSYIPHNYRTTDTAPSAAIAEDGPESNKRRRVSDDARPIHNQQPAEANNDHPPNNVFHCPCYLTQRDPHTANHLYDIHHRANDERPWANSIEAEMGRRNLAAQVSIDQLPSRTRKRYMRRTKNLQTPF